MPEGAQDCDYFHSGLGSDTGGWRVELHVIRTNAGKASFRKKRKIAGDQRGV
jgi:hypothetical protein